MQCKVENCDRQVRYKAACLCQKHYFRVMRNGTTELSRKAQERVIAPHGYVKVYVGSHLLGVNNGYIYEHRKVAFDKYGQTLPPCELCGKDLNWKTAHIDHKDNDKKNNNSENLRPLCCGCNTRRNYPEAHTIKGRHAIEFNGLILTANEWSRAIGGYLSHATIIRRIASGMTAEDALLTPKTTHKGEVPYTKEGLQEIARHYNAEARRLKKDAK